MFAMFVGSNISVKLFLIWTSGLRGDISFLASLVHWCKLKQRAVGGLSWGIKVVQL